MQFLGATYQLDFGSQSDDVNQLQCQFFRFERRANVLLHIGDVERSKLRSVG
jgi:hypothetical protein